MKNLNIFVLVFTVSAFLILAGCTQSQTAQQTPLPQQTLQPTAAARPADTVNLGNTTLGSVLTDAKGMTLYYFTTDLSGEGTSTCYGKCAMIWPVFSTSVITVSPPLMAADFGSINRTDGTQQTAYKGWPLYYFQNDANPGDVKGENVAKTWYVAKPDYTLMIATRPATGSYLTDGTGKTLYFFAKDTNGTSACTGACLTKWPAFSVDTISAPSVINTSDFSTVIRADDVKQIAFMGQPLYYYSGDMNASDLNGEGFNNVWFAANVTGLLPTPQTTVTTAITLQQTTSSMGYSSSSGY